MGKKSFSLADGFQCRECEMWLGSAKHYGLEFWQWTVLVGEVRWIIMPTLVHMDEHGNEIERTEGYALCADHRHLDRVEA